MSTVLLVLLTFALGLLLGSTDVSPLRVSWNVKYRLEWTLAVLVCGLMYWGLVYYPLALLLPQSAGKRSVLVDSESKASAHRRGSWPLAYSNKLQTAVD